MSRRQADQLNLEAAAYIGSEVPGPRSPRATRSARSPRQQETITPGPESPALRRLTLARQRMELAEAEAEAEAEAAAEAAVVAVAENAAEPEVDPVEEAATATAPDINTQPAVAHIQAEANLLRPGLVTPPRETQNQNGQVEIVAPASQSWNFGNIGPDVLTTAPGPDHAPASGVAGVAGASAGALGRADGPGPASALTPNFRPTVEDENDNPAPDPAPASGVAGADGPGPASALAHDVECSICHDDFVPNEELCSFYPCGHGLAQRKMHLRCVERWYRQCQRDRLRFSCPLCRIVIAYVCKEVNGQTVNFRAQDLWPIDHLEQERNRQQPLRHDIHQLAQQNRDLEARAEALLNARLEDARREGARSGTERTPLNSQRSPLSPSDISMRDQTPTPRPREDLYTGGRVPPGFVVDTDRTDSRIEILKEVDGVFKVAGGHCLLLKSSSRNLQRPDLSVYELEAQSKFPGAKAAWQAVNGEVMEPAPISNTNNREWDEFRVMGVANVRQVITVLDGDRVQMPQNNGVTLIRIASRDGMIGADWYHQSGLNRKFGAPNVRPDVHRYRLETGQHVPIAPVPRSRQVRNRSTRPLSEFPLIASNIEHTSLRTTMPRGNTTSTPEVRVAQLERMVLSLLDERRRVRPTETSVPIVLDGGGEAERAERLRAWVSTRNMRRERGQNPSESTL